MIDTIGAQTMSEKMERLKALRSLERETLSDLTTSVLRGYFPLPRDKTLNEELDELVDGSVLAYVAAVSGGGSGRLEEGRILVVIGESGAGKSRAIRHAFRKRKEFDGFAARNGSSILISVVAPSPCTLRQLGNALLEALGYETGRDLKENVVWQIVRRQVRLRAIRFIHVDEVQHVLQNSNPGEIRKIQDTLKGLLQTPDWPIWMILSGLPSVGDFVESDMQLRRRCRFVRFEPWSASEDANFVVQMIKSYAQRADLETRTLFADCFVSRLLHASLYQPGIAIEFVQDAATIALRRSAKALEIEHFASAYASRTGCRPQDNVFLVGGDWTSIDNRKALSPPDPVLPLEVQSKRLLVPRNR